MTARTRTRILTGRRDIGRGRGVAKPLFTLPLFTQPLFTLPRELALVCGDPLRLPVRPPSGLARLGRGQAAKDFRPVKSLRPLGSAESGIKLAPPFWDPVAVD